ncbi:MAG TPA: hypothetical protein PK836_06490 [Syntrophales bacterium]|nr:hypothetical protein [Syntrophales bacterium]HOM07298.1 hypothetical protein [Syntrophales bacterium]HOO00171.1 hypothetical protein [Syntrophales bacterium]HPC01320.1 hypothetical protein [Syntrophales bacterium]HPQ06857.1 hypothetical protein [Syntrophales bacterium]
MKKIKDLIAKNPDKRILKQKILKGEITEKDLMEYLKTLPDLSDNAVEMTVE